MRLSIKARQVAGVTTIVAAVVVGLSLLHIGDLAAVRLQESHARGEMLARAIYQRAREVVELADDPYAAIRDDPGIRSLLQSSIGYSRDVTYAAVIDPTGFAIAHSFPSQEGRPMPLQDELAALLDERPDTQVRAIYSDQTFEVRQPLLLENDRFGSIRIGMSTLLMREELMLALRPAGVTALVALAVATFGAMLLSQLMLRPIHVIRSGLSRLGRGEFGVTLDLPPGEEFTALGTSFNALSERLSSVRGPSTDVEPLRAGVVNEDAVVIVRATGEVAFANASMKARLQDGAPSKSYTDLFPDSHPFRMLITRALQTKQSSDPIRVREPVLGGEPRRHVVTVEVMGTDGVFEGVLLTARDLTYASQIEHMARSSRRLASVGRLLAGVAHEVKNPLNAMAIHLELLKQKLRGLTDPPLTRGGSLGARPVADAATGSGLEGVNGNLLKHVEVIDREIRRLDQVMQNFLKFVRPGELKLQPIDLRLLVAELLPVLETQTDRASVKLLTTCAPDLPSINGDAGMLKQALINLALNACQAMPDGGTLRITCQRAPGDRVSIDIEDTGIGIAPEQLERIFDLYFTTKEQGSGIGLSLVYRIVQLHDGDVEVQSIVGRGTTFRILLPRRTPSEHEEPASLGVAVT